MKEEFMSGFLQYLFNILKELYLPLGRKTRIMAAGREGDYPHVEWYHQITSFPRLLFSLIQL
jgi:hypothetical protein